jgi:CheY-like chemotaxis protein
MAALDSGRFDLVLMDVQMPEMDGVEATASIRRHEQQTGEHVPIIAMTANALKGSREQYMGAGMDAYIAKPVHPRELYAAIEGLVGDGAAGARAQSSQSVEPRLDWARALEATAGDEELLREVVRAFLVQGEQLLADIESSIASGNVDVLKRSIHTMRGALSHFGIASALRWAEEIRNRLEAGDAAGARESWLNLRAEMREITRELTAFLAGELNSSARIEPRGLI